ncbi:MAG: DUF1015 domain-containing protein [Clostridiales bacterium]|nr:DUF1015 domain-containing protein [Clostridiales bacterium]
MNNYSFLPAKILLPKSNYEKWSVIACDQYTSEQKYWDEVEANVGDAPSTLRITLPEIYLEENDVPQRIEKINKTMTEYINSGVLEEHDNALMYIERESSCGIRHGIVGVIDLEDYDYHKGSHALIRATEQTVLERIPPRVKIRKDAVLELPHIMLLIDDPDCTVIEPLKGIKDGFKKAYDFDLMQGGGHITGYFTDEDTQKKIGEALNNLVKDKEDKLMFAVGDGNHSLATAKECYNLTKSPLARYALVEVVNIHDSSIEFEPIYRVLFGADCQKLLSDMKTALGDGYNGADAQIIEYVTNKTSGKMSVKPTSKLPVGTLQSYLDNYLKAHTEIKIDYIHGEDSVRELCKQDNTIGFIFKGMQKNELFDAIKSDGSLPRKTFSMGHAYDKRYYIECRKIK